MSMVTLPGLSTLIESMSQQRNLPASAVQEALQEALLKGYERYRRQHGEDDPNLLGEDYFENFSVQLDLQAEGFRVVARKTIVEQVSQPDREISIASKGARRARASLGQVVMVDVTPKQEAFGRLAAHQTKMVLTQKLQEQQCKFVQTHFAHLRGTVLDATVRRHDRRGVVLAIDSGVDGLHVEAELPHYDKLPNDNYTEDAHFKVYLKKVYDNPSSRPLLRVSRASSHLIEGLLVETVPALREQQVEIKAISRDAIPRDREVTPRSKVAVASADPAIDPVAACLGDHGEFVTAIGAQMNGEKIEILPWSEDPIAFISTALSPAQVREVRLLDEEGREALVVVAADQEALANGPNAQNLHLAARLTGWKLKLETVAAD